MPMRPRLLFLLAASIVVSGRAVAQRHAHSEVQRIADSYIDSLRTLRMRVHQQCDSVARAGGVERVSPYYFRMVGPMTYYRSAVSDVLGLDDDSVGGQSVERLNKAVDRQLVQVYTTRPWTVTHHDGQFKDVELVSEQGERGKSLVQDVEKIIGDDLKQPRIENLNGGISDIGLKVKRPNFWTTKGSASLQFTQNYFSENWYRGGNNNGTMLASITLDANYNDQRRVTWDNKLEMRLGFITTPSDTCHSFLTNNDKLRLYSKLGVKAQKNWFYAISADANTQFMPGYRTNDRRTYSAFLAPLDLYVSVGMDYKPTLKNGNTLSVALLPFSYKMRYIGRDDENIHKAYQLVGRDIRQDYGSKVEVNARMQVMKDLSWKCRFYYFTSYEYTESELENSLSYALSKYISTELYTLWRFDDNRSRDNYDSTLGYFQFKEYFTLGLKYDF